MHDAGIDLYFGQVEREDDFALAHPQEGHPFIGQFQNLTRKLGVALLLALAYAYAPGFWWAAAALVLFGVVRGLYGPLYAAWLNRGLEQFCELRHQAEQMPDASILRPAHPNSLASARTKE